MQSDGEYFVDVARKPLAGSDSWPNMTTPQLMELMVELQNRAYEFRNHTSIAPVIQKSMLQLDAYIQLRINTPH